MTLQRRSVGPIEVVSFSGTLDATLAPRARRELMEVLDEGRTLLVIDLGAVRFIDSSGLSALVNILKAARARPSPDGGGRAGDVVLCRPAAQVRSVLELTRLHRILESFPDEDAAVARLAG